MNHALIPAVMLRFVQTRIRHLEELFDALAFTLLGPANAKTGCDPEDLSFRFDTQCFDRFAEAIGNERDRFEITVDDDHHEFLTAVPINGVIFSTDRPQAFAHFSEYGVARCMAIGIVEPFEMVDINDHDPKRFFCRLWYSTTPGSSAS